MMKKETEEREKEKREKKKRKKGKRCRIFQASFSRNLPPEQYEKEEKDPLPFFNFAQEVHEELLGVLWAN